MLKTVCSVLLCAALVLAMLLLLPNSAAAATEQETGNAILEAVLEQDGTFPETLPSGQSTYNAYCHVCKKNRDWTPMKTATSITPVDGGHYYMPTDITSRGQVFTVNGEFANACLHTNGKTATIQTSRIAFVGSKCVFNVMGGGTINSNTNGNYGVLYVNGGTVNVYGTTLQSTATAANDYGNAAISLRSASSRANLWGCTLVADKAVSPAILSNGVANLYNCTVTGQVAQTGDYLGLDGSKASLLLADTSVSDGVKWAAGTLSVSGRTSINGTGLELAEGKTIDPTQLTAGASIAIATKGAFTASVKGSYIDFFRPVDNNCVINADETGTLRCWPTGAALVKADGTEVSSDDVLTDWATEDFAYIKLYGDDSLELSGQKIVIDLGGFDLTVTGKGKIFAFDTANDTYRSEACGTILYSGEINFQQAVVAPNGQQYITVLDGNRATSHRLDIKLTSVTLRTSAAGLYYKATYSCDAVLAEKVQSYGVIVSVDNMPGADYADGDDDINRHTVAAEPFRSGITATSGSVFGIMKDSRTPAVNKEYAQIPIYANAYIDLGDGPIVSHTATPGKKVDDEGFTGVALSLYDVMFMLDDAYNKYNTTTKLQLDAFYTQWKPLGMAWDFVNIGQTAGSTDAVDNSNIELKFEEGTTNAQCPVCKQKVTWTPLNDETKEHNINGHYYLTKDLKYTGNANAFISNGTSNTTLCLHLNGHDITATKKMAFFGGSGKTNIMGNGEVSGANGGTGAAVQLNNVAANNGIFIYGGTWKKASNAPATTAVLGIHSQGGLLRVYAGATIDAPDGLAIKALKPTSKKNDELGVYGATVNGNVAILGGDPDKGYTSTVEFVDCTINGNVDVARYTDAYLAGELNIESVTLADKVLLTTKVLSKGSSIGITNDGIFTNQSESVKNYVSYFHGMDPAAKITVRDNALHCGPDYTGKLQFTEGTTNAVCPVCRKEVTWTPVDGSARVDNKTEQHYYLTNDVTFSSETAVSSFLNPGHGNYSVCFHLNGHDFTANTRFVYGGTSVTNVMGSGTVTCARSDAYPYGAAIQIHTAGANGTVNLYGGTWTQAEDSANANDYVVSISDNGGAVNIYEGATVKANSNGKAVYIGKCNLRDSQFGVYGGKVVGEVKAVGAAPAEGFASAITVDNGSIEGTLDINGVNTVTVSQAAKIAALDMEATSLIDMVELTVGADITVANTGVFTNAHSEAAEYADYFKPYNEVDRILVRDSALMCKTDFTAKLYPDAESNAYCPACRVSVRWTAISSADEAITFTDGGHYYLTKDLTYNGTDSGFLVAGGSGTVTCLHLNGNNVTATATKAIYGGSGKLNVMGSGTVSGYCVDANAGAAVHTNNYVATNGINLYGGTYKKYNGSDKAAVLAAYNNGGTINLYDGATVQNSAGVSIYLGKAERRNAELGIYGATVTGGTIKIAAANTEAYTSTVTLEDAKLLGTVEIANGSYNTVSVSRATQIAKLSLEDGVTVDFDALRDGAAIAVSATGDFSDKLALAEDWLNYISCADQDDWVVVRYGKFHQTAKPVMTPAADADKTVLDNAYAGTEVRYGEMHNHTNDGPHHDAYGSGADGTFSYKQWKAKMDEFGMDFATIVNHTMTLHMYSDNFEDFDEKYFIGGTEPGTRITTYDFQNNMHYNMLFGDPADLEALVCSDEWTDKFKPVKWEGFNQGIRFTSPNLTKEEMTLLANDVYAYGGLLVHVHPRGNHGYIMSDDPLDYYFADYTGFEISTGDKGNMSQQYNEEAYQIWVDLLELGKKVWATCGSDLHRIADTSALTTMYTAQDHRDEYFANMRTGNYAPGWVGIRMNIGDTVMGGETDFTEKRLQFSVGDIYAYEVNDANNKTPAYVEGHTYSVELYDDGGLLMETTIDPTELSYFAIDCDENAKFYRVVVRDVTDNERVGVSNPIWNTADQE